MEDKLRSTKAKKIDSPEQSSSELKSHNIRRRKKDRMDAIFQSLADIIYFLEFIEKHFEDLNGYFESDLKDIYGYNDLPLDENIRITMDEKRERYHKRGIINGPLMRLVRSLLLVNSGQKMDFLDFRTVALSNIFISQSVKALLQRVEDDDEKFLMSQDSNRLLVWSRYLAKQVEDIHYVPHRIIE